MTITATDIITQALRKLGVFEPSAADLSRGLDALNVMLKSWSGRSLLTTAEVQESFVLTGGKASYTLGAAAGTPDFTTVKPISISSGFIRDQNNTDYPISIISREEYNSFVSKSDTGLPENVFYDPGIAQQANQLGTFYLYLTPDSTNTYTLYLAAEKPFTIFASLTDTYTFPDIYERAMIYNVAIELAPEYGKQLHPEVIASADESLDIIEAINSSNKRTIVDLGLPGTSRRVGNILTGP
jgi:hypothetical protein